MQSNMQHDPNRPTENAADDQDFKQIAYKLLRQHFERVLPPLPDKDLTTLAAEEGGMPLEAFIDELKRMEHGS